MSANQAGRRPMGGPTIVWHWGTCSCGQTVYAREDQILHEYVAPGCCGATPQNFGCAIDRAHAHPAEQGTVVCMACKNGRRPKAVRKMLTSDAAGKTSTWHWFSCVLCGDTIDLREDAVTDFGIFNCTCGGAGNGATDHPLTHARQPEHVRCASCGYEATFHEPPRGGEPKESTMATKRRKKNGAAAAATPAPSALDMTRPVERARYFSQLPCKVDAATTARAQEELAQLIVERAQFLERRTSENASAREKRSYYDKRILELGRNITDRVETRSVEVIEEYIPATRKVQTRRADTGVVITLRDATDDDAQEELALEEEEAAIARAEAGDDGPKEDGPRAGDIEVPGDVLAGRVSGSDGADLFPEP